MTNLLGVHMLAQTFGNRSVQREAVSNGETLLFLWIGLGALAVIIQILMAIWVVKDSKTSGKSAGWAAFVAVPGIGLIGLFIYALIQGGPTEQEREMAAQLAHKDAQLQKVMDQQRNTIAQIETIKAEANQRVADAASLPPLQAQARNKSTQVINAVPSTVVSLTQFGGDNHGMTFTLTMRHPDGGLRKNTIGRAAECDLAFPEDSTMSDKHCMLLEDSGRVCVIDMGATNPTVLERDGHVGTIDSKTPLSDGDYLQIGGTRLRIMIIEPRPVEESIGSFRDTMGNN